MTATLKIITDNSGPLLKYFWMGDKLIISLSRQERPYSILFVCQIYIINTLILFFSEDWPIVVPLKINDKSTTHLRPSSIFL